MSRGPTLPPASNASALGAAGASPDGFAERRPRISAEHAMATIWLVFLVIPIVLVWSFDLTSLAWKILATVATAWFGITYSTLVLRQLRERESRTHALRHAVTGTLILLPPVIVAAPALSAGVASFAPFIAAIGVFSLTLRPALGWSVGVLAVTFGIVVLAEPNYVGNFFVGPAIGIVFLTIMRLLEDRSDAEQQARIELAWVREREAISRDIHDILGHTLTVVALKTQLARRLVQANPERAEAELDEVFALTQRALDEVRNTVGQLRTPDLSSQLEAAELALADAGIEVERHGSWDTWSPERRALAAWAVREATTNILRHSQARSCRIRFRPDALIISDDGIGLGGAEEGHGLTGLRRRVADGGGVLSIGERQGETELRVEFA